VFNHNSLANSPLGTNANKLGRYLALIIAAICSIKVIFASGGIGLTIYQLSAELEPGETIRANAYRIIIAYSSAVFIVGCTSLFFLVIEMRGSRNIRYVPVAAIAALLLFAMPVAYLYSPLLSRVGNPVLSQFANELIWLPIAAIGGAAVPTYFWIIHRRAST
jgi:hypothetical protein